MAANRMLRNTTDSKRVNSLSEAAEVTFYRLMMVADDFGSFHRDPELVLSAIYPRKTPNRENVNEDRIDKLLKELEEKGLIFKYEADGKELIRINKFGQRMQNFRSSFPHPSPELTVTHGESPLEEKRNRREDEVEEKRERMPNSKSKQKEFSLAQMKKFMEKNKAKLFPVELQKAKSDMIKLQEKNNWTEELLKKNSTELKKFDQEDLRIYEKHIGSLISREAEKCWNHYAKQNFKIKGEHIVSWIPVIAGWMDKRDSFKSKAS